MAYQVQASRKIVVQGSTDSAAAASASVLERFVFPPSWRKTDGGYDFWFYGNETNGSSGRISLAQCPPGERTQVRLTIEIHQTMGNHLDEVVNRLGLARQAKRITAAIADLALRGASAPKTLEI